MFSVSGHLANQAALCQPCSPPHFSNSGMRSIAACPKQAINDGLSSSNLVIHQLETTEVEKIQTDNRSLLKVKIRQALENIVSNEKAEAKMHQNLMQQESAGNKALIYTGAFLTGLWNAGSDLAVWLKDVNDVVNPAFRLMRSVRTNVKVASRVSAGGENIAAVYADEHLKAEKKELIEVLGFDPSSITSEQFDKTMEICELVWEDPDMQPMLWQFCKDYVAAQHAIELTSMSGEAAFEVLLTAILAAVTMGAGLALAAGAQVRHLRKFQKVGVLLKEFGEALRDLKIREKSRGVKANEGSNNTSLYDDKKADEVAVNPVTRKVENKPTEKEEKKNKEEKKPPTNKYPTSLAEAKERLAVSRANLTESGKYEPKYSQAELEAQVAQGTLDERFVVTLQKKKSDDLPVGFKRDSGRTTTWTTTFDQMEKADTDPKLLNDLNGMKWDPDAEWEIVVIDQHKQ